MTDLLKFVMVVITGFLQLAAQGYIVISLFRVVPQIKRIFMLALIVTVLHQIPYYLLPPKYITLSIIIYFLSMIISIKLIFAFKIIKSIFASSTILLISMLNEYLCMGFLKVIYPEFDSIIWSQDTFKMLIMRSIGLFMYFFTATVIYYFKIKVDLPAEISRKKLLFIILNTLIVFLLIIPNFTYFITSIPDTPQIIFVYNAFAIIVLFIFTLLSSLNFIELEKKSAEIEFKSKYANALNETVNKLRSFKHDFSNIILSIQGYALLNDVESIKKFISQINKETTHINSLTALNSYLKDSYSCYGLLISKISEAENKNITFNLNVTTKISEGKIEILDFCKLMGVLLDNAIEAASESKKKYIEFYAKELIGENGISVEIMNSYSGNTDTKKIFEDGYTTKIDHSGFGLWEVKQISLKYKDTIKLETFANDTFFTQKLTIYNI